MGQALLPERVVCGDDWYALGLRSEKSSHPVRRGGGEEVQLVFRRGAQADLEQTLSVVVDSLLQLAEADVLVVGLLVEKPFLVDGHLFAVDNLGDLLGLDVDVDQVSPALAGSVFPVLGNGLVEELVDGGARVALWLGHGGVLKLVVSSWRRFARFCLSDRHIH